MVGLNLSVPHLCQTRLRELQIDISRDVPDMDDRCAKNYALLISFAEMVSKRVMIGVANPPRGGGGDVYPRFRFQCATIF